ncbi:MAG: hypothetical protein ACE37K_03865 [Planctomycetota bacterium]
MATRHRPVSPRQRRRSRLLMPLAIAGVLLAGLVVYTVVNGELRLPFGGGVVFAFGGEEPQAAEDTTPPGHVEVFACPRDLPAYTKITREHLDIGDRLYTLPVLPEQVEPNGLIPNTNEAYATRLLGRVLRRPKPKNYVFRESDFLPKGTREGLSAGIPEGMRGIWVDISKVHGLSDVRSGDFVDLVAATASQNQTEVDTKVLGNLIDPVMKARLEAGARRAAKTGDSSSWVVARSAQVIAPVRSRELPGSGTRKGNAPTVEEVFLALAPQDVAQYSQALAQNVTILAAPRSSRPEHDPAEIQDAKPADASAELRKMLLGDDQQDARFRMVEVIRGGERQTITVPHQPQETGKR